MPLLPRVRKASCQMHGVLHQLLIGDACQKIASGELTLQSWRVAMLGIVSNAYVFGQALAESENWDEPEEVVNHMMNFGTQRSKCGPAYSRWVVCNVRECIPSQAWVGRERPTRPYPNGCGLRGRPPQQRCLAGRLQKGGVAQCRCRANQLVVVAFRHCYQAGLWHLIARVGRRLVRLLRPYPGSSCESADPASRRIGGGRILWRGCPVVRRQQFSNVPLRGMPMAVEDIKRWSNAVQKSDDVISRKQSSSA